MGSGCWDFRFLFYNEFWIFFFYNEFNFNNEFWLFLFTTDFDFLQWVSVFLNEFLIFLYFCNEFQIFLFLQRILLFFTLETNFDFSFFDNEFFTTNFSVTVVHFYIFLYDFIPKENESCVLYEGGCKKNENRLVESGM